MRWLKLKLQFPSRKCNLFRALTQRQGQRFLVESSQTKKIIYILMTSEKCWTHFLSYKTKANVFNFRGRNAKNEGEISPKTFVRFGCKSWLINQNVQLKQTLRINHGVLEECEVSTPQMKDRSRQYLIRETNLSATFPSCCFCWFENLDKLNFIFRN